MRRAIPIICILLLLSGCLTTGSSETYGYVHVENSPDNVSAEVVPAESVEFPSDVRTEMRRAANASEDPTVGERERFTANLTRTEYERLTGALSGSVPDEEYVYVSYRNETLKLYFDEKLIE